MSGGADCPCPPAPLAVPGRPGSLPLTLVLAPLLALWTVLVVGLGLPVLMGLKLVRLRRLAEAARLVIWWYGRGCVALIRAFVPVRGRGLSPASFPQPCIVVANHLSVLDVYFMGAQPVWNMCFVVKSWPWRIPFYRPFMRLAGYLDSDRLPAEELLARSRAVLEAGGSVLFFPEGRRSRDGNLGRFHSGAFALAVATGRPVVPLCLAGTDRLLPPGARRLMPAAVSLAALPAVDPAPFAAGPVAHIELRKLVKKRMSEALAALRSGADPHTP
jgi:1-acyl-sn-glycerol-3-phosphate acyltransferase